MRLRNGWRWISDLTPLLFVPIVTAFLSIDNISKVLAFHGRNVGVKLFGLPTNVVDIWTFVNVPNTTESGVHLATPIWAIALVAVVQSALLAGYLGSIRDALATGSYRFGESVRRYFVPLLLYSLAVFALSLGLLLAFLNLAFVVVVVVVLLAIKYLFYATPYVLVLRECDLAEAARVSYGLAVGGGAYARYAVVFSLFATAVSVLGTLVVVNLGLAGIVVGAVAAAPLGLALNVATMRFVADIDPGSPTLGTWDDGDGSNGGVSRVETTVGDDERDGFDLGPTEHDIEGTRSDFDEFGRKLDGRTGGKTTDGDERRRGDDDP